jgi:hypothetical protein
MQYAQLDRQPVWMREVIGILHRDVIRPAGVDRQVQGATATDATSRDEPYSRISDAPDNFHGAVRRAIIDDNVLDLDSPLCKHASHRRVNEPLGIERGRDDAYARDSES